MAKCIDCGRNIGMFEASQKGRCASCSHEASLATLSAINLPQHVSANESRAAQRDRKIAAVLLTTETASDLRIIKRLDVVTAECAFGMNIFKDLFASARDFFGGRSEAVQKTMRDARKTALYELRREAHLLGANAVVGVDLDYVELSAGASMVMLVASGTAVVIEDGAPAE